MKIGLVYELQETYRGKADDDSTVKLTAVDAIEHLVTTFEHLGYQAARIGDFDQLVRFITEGHRVELVFNYASGGRGRAPEVQVPAFLEAYGIPYTGADPFTFAVCSNQAMLKRLWFQAGLPVMVEPDFSSRVFAVGLLGGNGKAGVIGVGEVMTPQAQFGDEPAKNAWQSHLFRPVEGTSLRRQLFDLARQAYLSLDCQAFARVDIRFDRDHQPRLWAIHPNPSLQPLHAAMPVIAQYAGISYSALIAEILHLAARSHHRDPQWLPQDLYLSDTGSLRGLGVFAGRNFQQGEIVARATGHVIPTQTEYSIQIDWDRHLEVDYPVRQMNHSCDPNLGIKTNSNGFPMFVALRNITSAEELTWDYAMTEYTHYKRERPELEFDLTCHCGAPTCRGKFGYYSELPETIKKKYAGFVAEYLLTK